MTSTGPRFLLVTLGHPTGMAGRRRLIHHLSAVADVVADTSLYDQTHVYVPMYETYTYVSSWLILLSMTDLLLLFRIVIKQTFQITRQHKTKIELK